MTGRVLLTVLMLTQVLACPFLDCGECGGTCGAMSFDVDDACRDCCPVESTVCDHETDPCDSPACPDSPGILTCLCGGAVQINSVECPDLLTGSARLALTDTAQADSSRLARVMSSDFKLSRSPHFPPLISGTTVCALTQNYLL